MQSAAVGQSGLETEKIGSGSENVITVLIRAESFVIARTAPVCPAACHRWLALTLGQAGRYFRQVCGGRGWPGSREGIRGVALAVTRGGTIGRT